MGREVSIAHMSRECPHAGPLASLRLADSIHFKHSDPFPLETVRGGSSRSGFSGEPSSYCEEKEGAQSLGTEGTQLPADGAEGLGAGGGKGLSAGQTLRAGVGAALGLAAERAWSEDPACPGREPAASQALPVRALSRVTRLPQYTFHP